jgi:hypothetical protein
LSSTSGFRKHFVWHAPEPFVVPCCMAAVFKVGGRRCPLDWLCFSLRQWAPWPLPTSYPLRSVTHMPCGVVPDSAGPLVSFPQKPTSASKKEHGRPERTQIYHERFSSLPINAGVRVSNGSSRRGRTWTHAFVVGESTRAGKNQNTLYLAETQTVRRYEPHAIWLRVLLCPCQQGHGQ